VGRPDIEVSYTALIFSKKEKMMVAPLEGIRAVEWGEGANGPLIGVILGDFGADVVKVEQRGVGDPHRGIGAAPGRTFASGVRQPRLAGAINAALENTNRSKRSISLDLKKPRGKEVMYRLVEKADVFYTNYGQATATKVGMDYESLSKVNPRLIYANATGNGPKGPYAYKPSFDHIIQARSGMMTALGERGTIPSTMVGTPVDCLGATVGAMAIITALLCRERTGIGQMTNTSLLHSALWLQLFNIQTGLFRAGTRTHLGQQKRLRSELSPLNNQYQCSDGKWILLGGMQWTEFCQVMGINQPEYTSLDMKALQEENNRKCVVSYLEGVFATKPRGEWIKLFEEKNVSFMYSPINEVDDLLTDVQVVSNNFFIDFEHPTAGPVKYVSVPVQFSKTPAKVKSAAPEFAQHTEEVLLEIGYTVDDIAGLREEEVI
jgi:crotonobetainyl-CoA:carnitine CoA-transferase CaiB-like acyl-CoA transferase